MSAAWVLLVNYLTLKFSIVIWFIFRSHTIGASFQSKKLESIFCFQILDQMTIQTYRIEILIYTSME